MCTCIFQQVRINGSWLGTHDITVRGGSLESSNPFSIVREGGNPMFLKGKGMTEFLNEPGVSLRGWIATDRGWGPDARVELVVPGASVTIAQHTEGRGESGNAMLDLSVSGLANLVDSIGGWLGLDGALEAGEAPAECRDAQASWHRVAPKYTFNSNQEHGNLKLLFTGVSK